MNMKMRNFFSPFINLSSTDFEEVPIKVGLTVFTQNNKRVFLVTTTSKEVLQANLVTHKHVTFSGAYRDHVSCLVIEGCNNKAEGKIIPSKSHVMFRATGCVFLPVENHIRRDITAYITTLGNGEKIIVIPLPGDYRSQNLSSKEKLAPQPYVENWQK